MVSPSTKCSASDAHHRSTRHLGRHSDVLAPEAHLQREGLSSGPCSSFSDSVPNPDTRCEQACGERLHLERIDLMALPPQALAHAARATQQDTQASAHSPRGSEASPAAAGRAGDGGLGGVGGVGGGDSGVKVLGRGAYGGMGGYKYMCRFMAGAIFAQSCLARCYTCNNDEARVQYVIVNRSTPDSYQTRAWTTNNVCAMQSLLC